MSTRNGQPSPGDMTGRLKQQNAKEQAQASEERQAEMSMQNQAQSQEELDGVFDPQSGERIDSPSATRDVEILGDEEFDFTSPPQPLQQSFGDPGFGGSYEENEPVFSGQEPPEVVAPALAARKTFTPSIEIARDPYVKIRVDQDIEDMTYGMRNGEPNNFSFKEGLTYKVPVGVADHLNERGLIRQYVR